MAEHGDEIRGLLAAGATPAEAADAVDPDPVTGDGLERRDCCGTPVGGEHRFGCEAAQVWDAEGRRVG